MVAKVTKGMAGAKAEVEIYPGAHPASPFPSGRCTTGWPPNAIGSAFWRSIAAISPRHRKRDALSAHRLSIVQSDRGRDRTVRDPLVRARPISAEIIFGWLYARSLIKKDRLWAGASPISLVQIDDFILWVTLGIILGGRTGYVLFYNLPFFIEHPAAIFKLWEGGMSFHGGFLGCVVAVMWFARKNGISILSLGDITCGVAPIGIFLVRLTNFINGELWGRAADPSLPWAMIFPTGGGCAAPSEPALRSRHGGHHALHRACYDDPTGRLEAPRHDPRRLYPDLRADPDHRRAFSRAGRPSSASSGAD